MSTRRAWGQAANLRSRNNPAYGWVVLSTFTLNYSVIVIALFTLGLLLPEISNELSLSPSEQGLLASSVLFGNLIFEIPANWFFSRFRPWKVAGISFVGAALFVSIGAWAPTFAVLLIARMGLGVFYLSSHAPRTLVILHWMPSKHIGLANGILFGVIEALEGVGFIIIPLILVWLGDWRDTLYTWAMVCMIAAILWWVLGRDRVGSETVDRDRTPVTNLVSSLFKYREPWILGLGAAGSVGGRFAFGTFWPTYTGDEYGTAVTLAGLIIGLISIFSFPAILGVTILPFFARRTPLLLMICGIGLCATYLGMLFTDSLPILFLLGAINGLTFSFFPAIMTVLYRLSGITPRGLAIAVALLMTLNWAGAALGPFTTGFIQEATDNLRLALVIPSLGPLLLTAAGLMLSDRGTKIIRLGLSSIRASD